MISTTNSSAQRITSSPAGSTTKRQRRLSFLEKLDSWGDAINHSYIRSTTALWDDILYEGAGAKQESNANKSSLSPPAIRPKYETLNIYGQNLVGTEGAEWKRHRHVSNSAFNEANNAFVWRETIRVVEEWFTEIDAGKSVALDEYSVDLLKDLTQVALLIIASAGFGRRASYKEDSKEEPPAGHQMAFRPALTSTIHHVITKAITPTFLWNLSDRFHIPFITPLLTECRTSFAALGSHMHEVIASARDLIATGKEATMDSALLRNLVQANMVSESAEKHLTDDELLSNTFTFLLAGHETSAHSLCFSIVLLALYPEVQQQVFDEVIKLWPDGLPSSYAPSPYKESIASLEYTLAVFHETLRLFPAVSRLAKNVEQDTTLTVRRFDASTDGKISNVEKYDVTMRRGSMVIIDIRALHFNPIHWGNDVEEFKPSRFIDTETYRWPRDASFLNLPAAVVNAFSAGPRSCIGQRFSLTESACILAHIVRKYEVHVPDDLRNKPWEEQKRILLDWNSGITATPKNARAISLILRKQLASVQGVRELITNASVIFYDNHFLVTLDVSGVASLSVGKGLIPKPSLLSEEKALMETLGHGLIVDCPNTHARFSEVDVDGTAAKDNKAVLLARVSPEIMETI
ncbi:hypothetical protein H0H93_003095 [Arthromyces matolae]|nr:hypothetical protein H0H93_003095 [Arthromyces matolae]